MTLFGVHSRVRRAALHGALLVLGLSAALAPAVRAQGQTITLRVTNAPIQDVLRGLFQDAGKNYTLAPDLAGRVTVDLQGVPFADALAKVCAAAVPPVTVSQETLGTDVLYHVHATPPAAPAGSPADTAALAADPQIRQIAAADTGFGLRLLGQLSRTAPQGGNVFFSPYSITQALALAYNGAGGDTARSIATTLGLDALTRDGINAAFGRLRPSLANPDPQVELSVANALWANTGVTFAPDFQGRCQTFYGAQATTLDLRAPAGADTINAWVGKNTRGKITELVSQADLVLSRWVLTDGVYFHGKWQTPFDKAETRDGPFTLSSGSTKMVPLMSRTGQMRYRETPQFQVVALPYGTGRVSLYVLLPASGSDLDTVTSGLDAQAWQQLVGQMKPSLVGLTLPRFKTDFAAKLSGTLTALGMGVAFTESADFTPMGAGSTAISDVIHKATLEVDEEGTVATAATAVIGGGFGGGGPSIQPIVVRVDHPFLCAIQDDATGAVLFLGTIADPQPQVSANRPTPTAPVGPARTIAP